MQQYKRPNRIILGLLSLGLLAGAALTANQAQAVEAPGPYYAKPSWDRKLACPTIANCPRFVVLTNWNSEAVLDTETGLVWERSPSVTMQQTWAAARLQCTARTTGTRKGWRLPSMPELASLFQPNNNGNANEALPPGHPFLNIAPGYWSATTVAEAPTGAWVMNSNPGRVELLLKTLSIYVWCVRGGNNADQY